jgi:hypothetical protein
MNIKEGIREGIDTVKGPLMAAGRSIKRVTLNDIYTAIETNAEEFRHKHEASSQYFNQRIDNLGQKVDNLGSQLSQKIDVQGSQLSQKMDAQGQRIDTVMQMLLELSKQMLELSKQKNV